MSTFDENAPQEPEPEVRILHTGEGKVLIGLTMDDLNFVIQAIESQNLTRSDEHPTVVKLTKARGLLNYSTKREAYVSGKSK